VEGIEAVIYGTEIDAAYCYRGGVTEAIRRPTSIDIKASII